MPNPLDAASRTSNSQAGVAPDDIQPVEASRLLYVNVDDFNQIQRSNTDRLVDHLELLRLEQARGNDTVQALLQHMQQQQSLLRPAEDTANCKSPKKEASDEFLSHAPEDQGKLERPLMTIEQSVPPSTDKAVTGSARKSLSSLEISPMAIQGNNMLAYGIGFSGKRKLLQYNFNKLQAFGAIPAAFAECSIFRLRRSLLFQVLIQPLFILAVFGLAKLAAGDEPERLRSQLMPVLSVPERLRQLVAFLLGLFVALQLKRWWSIRSNFLQGFFFATAQISWYINVVLPKGCDELGQRVERYFLMAHRIIYFCARGEHHLLHRLQDEGLLTLEEMSHLKARFAELPDGAKAPLGFADMDLAEVPIMWVAQIIYRAHVCSQKHSNETVPIPPPVMLKMVSLCMDARSSIQDIEMIRTSPVPFPYVHIVCLLVQFYVIFACLASGIELATDKDVSLGSVCTELLVIPAQNTLYLALLCLTTVLDNPFLDEVIDFPAMHLQNRLWKSQIFARAALYPDKEVDAEIRSFYRRNNQRKEDELDEEEPAPTAGFGSDDFDDGDE